MARRNQRSALNDIVAISMKIPLWANAFAAVTLFAGLRYYGGAEAPWMNRIDAPQDLAALGQFAGSQVLKSICYLGQFVIPPIFIIGGLLGWIQRKIQAKKFNRISYAQDPGAAIRSLSWHEFERMTGEAFRRKGFTVKQTKKGPDGGIDLVLNLQSELFLVQCKQWRSQKVSVQVVRELYGVIAAQGAAGGFVVTSGAFTVEAKKFSHGTNIQLVDGEKLTHWFAKLTEAK